MAIEYDSAKPQYNGNFQVVNITENEYGHLVFKVDNLPNDHYHYFVLSLGELRQFKQAIDEYITDNFPDRG